MSALVKKLWIISTIYPTISHKYVVLIFIVRLLGPTFYDVFEFIQRIYLLK